MRAAITNSLVKELTPRQKPYEVRDSQLKGLILRVQPSGVKTYYVEYGRGKRKKIGRADPITPALARDKAKEIQVDYFRGIDPMATKKDQKSLTLRSFIDTHYVPWVKSNIRTSSETIDRLRSSFKELLDKRLSEITGLTIEKWRTSRMSKGYTREKKNGEKRQCEFKASTLNRDLDDLKSALRRAVQWGVLDSNPAAHSRKLPVDPMPTARYLTKSEEARLCAALVRRDERIKSRRRTANRWRHERNYPSYDDISDWDFADHLHPMVLLSLHTGIRQGEMFSLSWSNVDFEHRQLTVEGIHSKNQKTRHVRLCDEAKAVLRKWQSHPRTSDSLVFPSKNGYQFDNVSRAWGKVLLDAGITNFRWHDLRHTYASNLAMAGIDILEIRNLLGHSDTKMTLRYAHLAPDHMARTMAKYSQWRANR